MSRKPVLIAHSDAADLLGISPSYFSVLRKKQETHIPIYRAEGKVNYYKRSDLMAFKKIREKKNSKKVSTKTNI